MTGWTSSTSKKPHAACLLTASFFACVCRVGRMGGAKERLQLWSDATPAALPVLCTLYWYYGSYLVL